MTLGRRDFVKLAAGAGALPLLSHRCARAARAQPAERPPAFAGRARAPWRGSRAAFMDKYEVPALSFAIGYAGAIVHQDAFGLADREQNEP